MTKTEIITQTWQLLLIPAIILITGYLITFIQTKKTVLKEQIKNTNLHTYIDRIVDDICSAVSTTNNTYVNALKRQGKFDEAAQKEAFKQTYEAVITSLTTDAKKYLDMITTDIDKWLTEKIEAEVVIQKGHAK